MRLIGFSPTSSSSPGDRDLDQDGFGDIPYETCDEEPPPGYAEQDGDCDDGDDGIHPQAEEECDGVDNDCDGEIDEGVLDQGIYYYQDSDGDGYGTQENSVLSCIPLSGFSPDSGDCDDTDPSVYPNAPELCDDVQNDCNETGCSPCSACKHPGRSDSI